MTKNLIQIDSGKLTIGNFLRSLLINTLINTAIAGFLTVIGFGKGFIVRLIFSQCIGHSIFLSSFAAIPLFRAAKKLSHQILIIVSVVVFGAVAGTVLGTMANGMNPALFIRENSGLFAQATLLGLLFGSIISYVFISLGMISEEKVKRLEVEKKTVETELRLLQSQVEPHFLFNTLSNIMSLIDADPAKARRMLEAFTSFLRASFLTARDRTVTLSQEIDVVKNYLDVFTVRMGDRLTYRIDIPDSLYEFRIPPLLVQPLVENAVKHGLEPAVRGGEILIEAVRDGDSIRIAVADSGMGINEKSAGSGIGIESIRKRLRLLYGERGRLILEENTPSGVKVVMEIPYEGQ